MAIYRGYSGVYKGTHLRSSLEFAYAYYLDHKGISWSYEEQTFDLNGESYKPDFFLKEEIVEIKGTENYQEGLRKANLLKELYGVKIRVLSYKHLLRIYQEEMPISLNRSKKIWINDFGAILNGPNVHGKNNPMFGKKHSEKTKDLISKKAREPHRVEIARGNAKIMYQKNLQDGFVFAKKRRAPWEVRKCEYCGSTIEVRSSSKRRFCSLPCANKTFSQIGADVLKQQSRENLDDIKAFMIEWCTKNKDIVKSTLYNKITTTLCDMLTEIYTRFNIKDMRIISKAWFGEDRGRKELLKSLKEFVG